MDHLFVAPEFEEGMCFLVDTLANCIENRVHGWINQYSSDKKFHVSFIFLGLKSKLNDKKRKSEDDSGAVLKKIRKLNVSIENLLLAVCGDDAVQSGHAIGDRRTRSCLNNGSKLNSVVDFASGDVSDKRKRKMKEDDVNDVQPKKPKKK